jgi:ADP-heptose:LPS heptosyltransferase
MLRFTDRYLGMPLCLLLTVCRFILYPLRRRRKYVLVPRRVLVIKMSEMGSTVLAYPALAELKSQVQDIELYFLVFGNNRGIIDALKLTTPDRIISIDVSSAGRLISSGFGAIRRLIRARIDTTIDMDFFSRLSAAFAFVVCRGNRVGFHRYTNEGLNRGRLLTHEVLYSAHVHTSVAFMALVRSLFRQDKRKVRLREKVEGNFDIPRYVPEKADIDSVKGKLKDLGIDAGRKGVRIVIVNPNSSDLFPLRRWPLASFASVCSRLISSRDDVRIVITGTDSERIDAEEIMDAVRYPQCVSLAGNTTFPELLALHSISSLMITNDSGPAHFAALTGLPAVVLFGPETPVLYGPLGGGVRCLYAGFACSPCVSVSNGKLSPCDRSLCLEAITVDKVLRCSLESLEAERPEKRGQRQANV